MPEAGAFLPIDEACDRWSSFYDCDDNPVVFAAGQIVHGPAEHVRDAIKFGCGTGRNLER